MKNNGDSLTNYFKYDKKGNNNKVYYSDHSCIGSEYDMVKYLISKGNSSSKAHKIVSKIKQLKEDKNGSKI